MLIVVIIVIIADLLLSRTEMITTITTMQTLSFEQIQAETKTLNPQPHYISSLQGSVYAGETVLLDEEVVLTVALRSKVAAVLRKEAASHFLVNFYVFPGQDSIQVPRLPVPRRRTYIGFPAQEVLQTKYVSVVPEGSLQALAFLVNEEDILSGRKAFCIGMSDCFFLRFQVDTNLALEPIEVFSIPQCRSLTQQAWPI
jgi:hypothetical protein